MKITNRHTNEIIFEDDSETRRETILSAIKNEADLRGSDLSYADLRGSDLSYADLRGSDLSYADLSYADLHGSDLRYADLRYADLHGSDLRYADLRYADLYGSNLRYADLRYADLHGSDLRYADLRYADLHGSDLSYADLSYADLHGSDIPIVENIDARILSAIEAGGKLDMGSWHTCETTHCRAGWAITLAGKPGMELERKVGSNAAGVLIYAASRPGVPVPNFFADEEEAMADIRKCAMA